MLIRFRVGRGNAATQTIDPTTIQNQQTVTSGTTTSPQQQQESETDGIDPALLRSKVVETIFPGQTVRSSVVDLLLLLLFQFLLLSSYVLHNNHT